jgi:hypothetical protein
MILSDSMWVFFLFLGLMNVIVYLGLKKQRNKRKKEVILNGLKKSENIISLDNLSKSFNIPTDNLQKIITISDKKGEIYGNLSLDKTKYYSEQAVKKNLRSRLGIQETSIKPLSRHPRKNKSEQQSASPLTGFHPRKKQSKKKARKQARKEWLRKGSPAGSVKKWDYNIPTTEQWKKDHKQ